MLRTISVIIHLSQTRKSYAKHWIWIYLKFYGQLFANTFVYIFRYDLSLAVQKKRFYTSVQWIRLLLYSSPTRSKKEHITNRHHTHTHTVLKVHNKTGHFHWIRLQYNENVEFFQYNKSFEMIAFVSVPFKFKNENK